MSVNVAFFPGWLGSSLGFVASFLGYRYPIWPNPLAIGAGQLSTLQLAADGVGPGPYAYGSPSSAIDVLSEVYGPLLTHMNQQGFNVIPVPLDWRKSLSILGEDALDVINTAIGAEPFAVVAHSHGGLAARQMYSLLAGAGQDARLTRMVTLGTPHFGCMEGVRCLFRLSQFYSVLQGACGWQHFFRPDVGPDFIDAVIASFPSIYELMPFKDYGWLFDTDQGQVSTLWTDPFFSSANPYFSAGRLAAAPAVQDAIRTALPPGRLHIIAGYGFNTAVQLDTSESQGDSSGYVYSDQGDGIVGVGYTSVPGYPVYYVREQHSILPSSWQVWDLLYGLIVAGVPSAGPAPFAL